jgi:hypothetical protein
MSRLSKAARETADDRQDHQQVERGEAGRTAFMAMLLAFSPRLPADRSVVGRPQKDEPRPVKAGRKATQPEETTSVRSTVTRDSVA